MAIGPNPKDTATPPLFEVANLNEATAAASGLQPPYFRNHRWRLRFLEGAAAAMPDYELLELVLFRAIPHQTLKPLARRLFENLATSTICFPPASISYPRRRASVMR